MPVTQAPRRSHTTYNGQPSSPSDLFAATFFHRLLHFPAPCYPLPREHYSAPWLWLRPEWLGSLWDFRTMNEEHRGTTYLLLLTWTEMEGRLFLTTYNTTSRTVFNVRPNVGEWRKWDYPLCPFYSLNFTVANKEHFIVRCIVKLFLK